MTLSETRELVHEGKDKTEDAIAGGLAQTSDQILGENNIGNGPFNRVLHTRPAVMKQGHANRLWMK